MKTNQGFNLIEIMIGITIVGLLLAFAVPVYQRYIERADVNGCFNFITPARMTADILIQNNTGSSLNILGASDIGLQDGFLSDENDCETINIANQNVNGDIDINATVRGNTLRWRRNGLDGTWVCSSSDASLGIEICP